MCHLHDTQLKYENRERLKVKGRKERNQTNYKNNKAGMVLWLSDTF